MFNVKKEIMKERVLMLFACLFASVMLAVAQNFRVTGVVVDETGEPVIGASVLVDGTNRGAVTNIDGEFTIENVPCFYHYCVLCRLQELADSGKSQFYPYCSDSG